MGDIAAVFFGNAITSLIVLTLLMIMQSLSIPGAIPPWGGGENLNASSRKPKRSCATSSGTLQILKILFCSLLRNQANNFIYQFKLCGNIITGNPVKPFMNDL